MEDFNSPEKDVTNLNNEENVKEFKGENDKNIEDEAETDEEVGSCVYLSSGVFEFIDEYVKNDTSQELGGFLLGYYQGDKNNFSVWIEGAVEAAYTEPSRSGLKFTHRTWEVLAEEIDKHYPDCYIVGWFHSHPGLGTYLTKHDIFIHEMFFSSYWQVSYVIDPLLREHAFYGWNHYDEISPISFKMEGEPLYIALSRKEKEKMRKDVKKRKKSKGSLAGAGITAAVFIVLIFALAFLNQQFIISPLQQEINELESELEDKEEAIWELEAELEDAISGEEEEGIVEEPEGALETEENDLNAEENDVTTYTVESDDSLYSICEEYYGDGTLFEELAEYNNLPDARNVETGTVIEIPEDLGE